ncbi:MAG: hypothetical protein N2509_07705, partial [Treponemataceae bacterium]|nr:hypothetical protein [Treponemataceae bacterium]
KRQTIGGVIVWKIAQSPQQRWERLLQGLLAGWIGLMIVWAGFAFTLGPIRGLPGVYPAPDYWAGIFEQAQSSERRWVFALEKRQFGNWWWYFPLAFLIKNPLPLLFAFLISVAYVFRLSYRMCPMVPLSFSIIYTGIAIGNGMNIGYRHMLPIHPVIYLLVGRGTTLWLSSPPFFRKRFIGLLMGFWYIAGTICIFPYEIAYFNELIGGPQNAHHYLIDSNLDWGQGYKALRRYLSSHPGPTPKMIYQYAYIPPEYYKIPVLAFPVEDVAPSIVRPFHPDPGRYILNITTVQSGWLPGSDVYFWFRQARPTATVGYSFFIYDVDRLPPQWIAQCSVPVTPLSKEVIIWGFGQRNLRQIEFNCESGWIYPFGGTQPGVYGFHYALLKARRETLRDLLFSFPEPRDLFLSRHLEQTRLSVDMKQYTVDYPAFALYELEGFLKMPAVQSAIYLSESGVPAGTLRSDTVPLALKGPLTFLGVNTFWENSEMNVETWWQVTEGPITRPLSIMGHLLNEAGEMIGQDDGLGVPPVIWQPGDIIVQRHRFPLPPKGEKFWLRTGVYWLDTMERWAIAEKPDLDIIFIKLPEAR